jgi:hypothetical protein
MWVCENYKDRPWSESKPNGCMCGAGAPCPDCNPCDLENPPKLPPGTRTEIDKDDGWRH